MKRISHYKTYNPHQFIYDKIELSEDFPTEKPDEECFRELLERIEAMAKVAYPWLYEQEKPFVNSLATKAFINAYSEPERFEAEEPEQKPLLQLIQESKTLRELKSWELLIKVEKDKVKREELSTTYETKLAELTQKTTA
jgi:hypothetical protein